MPSTRKESAGLLLFRRKGPQRPEVLLVHPGGPFWSRRDAGAWSIPKGIVGSDEDALAAARREFAEETGYTPPERETIELGAVRQPGGKWVRVWAVEGDWDPSGLVSNTFEMEWPRQSGRVQRFPEADRAEWFDIPSAREKILKGQIAFLDRLLDALKTRR